MRVARSVVRSVVSHVTVALILLSEAVESIAKASSAGQPANIIILIALQYRPSSKGDICSSHQQLMTLTNQFYALAASENIDKIVSCSYPDLLGCNLLQSDCVVIVKINKWMFRTFAVYQDLSTVDLQKDSQPIET